MVRVLSSAAAPSLYTCGAEKRGFSADLCGMALSHGGTGSVSRIGGRCARWPVQLQPGPRNVAEPVPAPTGRQGSDKTSRGLACRVGEEKGEMERENQEVRGEKKWVGGTLTGEDWLIVMSGKNK